MHLPSALIMENTRYLPGPRLSRPGFTPATEKRAGRHPAAPGLAARRTRSGEPPALLQGGTHAAELVARSVLRGHPQHACHGRPPGCRRPEARAGPARVLREAGPA